MLQYMNIMMYVGGLLLFFFHVSSICVSGAKEKISDVFTVLIHYLDNPDSDPTVSCVCFCLCVHVHNLFYLVADFLLQ